MFKMFVKDSYDKNVTRPNDEEEEDKEDVLSFYDLWINGDADAWEDSSRSESQNSEQEGDDYFEFFSEELKPNKATSDVFQPENIIFCGKIIPYKQPICDQNPTNIIQEKKHKTQTLFKWRWSFSSSHKSRTSVKNNSSTKKELRLPESPKQKRSNKLHGFSLSKITILTSPSKSRWYLYLFGITRFRSEMELKEIKNRQSRRSPSFSLFRLESSDDNKREGKGSWGLLRALSCINGGDHQINTLMPASSIDRIMEV